MAIMFGFYLNYVNQPLSVDNWGGMIVHCIC